MKSNEFNKFVFLKKLFFFNHMIVELGDQNKAIQ